MFLQIFEEKPNKQNQNTAHISILYRIGILSV